MNEYSNIEIIFPWDTKTGIPKLYGVFLQTKFLSSICYFAPQLTVGQNCCFPSYLGHGSIVGQRRRSRSIIFFLDGQPSKLFCDQAVVDQLYKVCGRFRRVRPHYFTCHANTVLVSSHHFTQQKIFQYSTTVIV